MEKNQPKPVGIWILASTGAGGIPAFGLEPNMSSRELNSRPYLRKLSCSTTHLLKCSVGQRPIGAGGIRTPGARRHNGFQDRRFQPLSHCSKTTPLLYKQPSLLQIV
jgi:hypothetical protein